MSTDFSIIGQFDTFLSSAETLMKILMAYCLSWADGHSGYGIAGQDRLKWTGQGWFHLRPRLKLEMPFNVLFQANLPTTRCCAEGLLELNFHTRRTLCLSC